MTRHRHIICIAIAATSLSIVAASCGFVARHVSEEAATELGNEVRDELAEHDAPSKSSVTLLRSVLDPIIERERTDPDAVSSFVPAYTGLADADGDGLDDDGRIGIRVRHADVCLTIVGDAVAVHDGAC